jgi:hypothetical protein
MEERLLEPGRHTADRARGASAENGRPAEDGRAIVRLACSLQPLVARVADGEEREAALLLERIAGLLRSDLVLGSV